MNKPVYVTIRVNLDEIKELMKISTHWKPSRLKVGWIMFQSMRNKELVSTLKEKGAWIRPTSTTTCEVHVSLTKLTTSQLLDVGLIPNTEKFYEDYAVTIMEAGLTGVLYTPIRDDLFRVKLSDEYFYVIAPNIDFLERRVDRVITMIHRFAYEWAKWQATATVVVVEGKDVLKFENGLSVRMILDPVTFCQAEWNGEYHDFSNHYHFYWWLNIFL